MCAEKIYSEIYKVEEIKTEIFALLLNITEYYCIGLALRREGRIVKVRVGKVLNVCELVFVELYPVLQQQAQTDGKRISYVDLRYDSGAAVGWAPLPPEESTQQQNQAQAEQQ